MASSGGAIAKANVLIAANADDVGKTLRGVDSDLNKWGKAKGKDNGRGFAASFAGGLKGAGPLAGAALGAAGLTLGVDSLLDTIEDIKKQGDIAGALGMSPEAFTGMAGIAKSVGGNTKEFIESLVTMGKLGTDAAKGTEAASDAMKLMGINVEEFNKLAPDKQFYKIHESLMKMGPGLDRTRALMAAFGEDGGKILIPMLNKTPEELKKMGAQFALTGEQIRKATEAQKAVDTMKQTFNKGWQQFAVAAAPTIKAVVDGIGTLIEAGKPFFDWVGRAFGRARDIANAVWGEISTAATEAWTWIKEQTTGAFDWVGQLPTIQETVTAVFRVIGSAGALMWDALKVGAGAFAVVIGETIKALYDLQQYMIDAAKALPEWARNDTINDFLAGAEEGTAKGKAFFEKWSAWGKGAIANFGSSAEQFNGWLDAMVKRWEKEPAKAIAEVQAMAAEAKGKTPDKMPGFAAALDPKSAAAYSLQIKNQFRDLLGDKDTGKAQLKEQKGINKNTAKTKEGVDKIGAALAGVGAF